ncbi:hypothetical protein PVAP13_5KG386156 [Panicum virgatum]|uniref:Uncharacterized protein n=1 Tax=Panicum virgatum TaxID=38727 RepID=A0A8T0SNU5_PANVG|nr:hypothetical protein PVAP13_5KG386156 [Panicum virgatum]
MSISSSSFRRSLLTFVLIGDNLANLPCSKDLNCLIALCTERSERPKDTSRLEIFVTSCASGNDKKEKELIPFGASKSRMAVSLRVLSTECSSMDSSSSPSRSHHRPDLSAHWRC